MVDGLAGKAFPLISRHAYTSLVTQSAAFQKAFAGAVATAAGLPAASVSVTSVSQVTTRYRRAVLQAGINVAYAVTTTAAAAATVTAVLGSSGGAVTTLLAASYPGVTAANPIVSMGASVAPTATPSRQGPSLTPDTPYHGSDFVLVPSPRQPSVLFPPSAAPSTTAAPTAGGGLIDQAKALLTTVIPPLIFLAIIVFVIGEVIKRVYSIPTWAMMCSELKLFCCPPATH